jgi:hypothetical protein
LSTTGNSLEKSWKAPLKVGTDFQTITVSSAATMLETDTSDRGETIQAREAVNLPLNGRSYADLSTLVPGVRKSLLERFPLHPAMRRTTSTARIR